jgi:hypothetical protein
METLYSDCSSYNILGKELNIIINEDLDNIVVEFDGSIYYLENEGDDLGSAIMIYQDLSGKELTDKEMKQILKDN